MTVGIVAPVTQALLSGTDALSIILTKLKSATLARPDEREPAETVDSLIAMETPWLKLSTSIQLAWSAVVTSPGMVEKLMYVSLGITV